ncbi:uncharacterized protein V2V93DRAFT_261894 [Kockiozyma suomiensis]|uniref:uncharacterized protein n=1 Tax=Kockiozyma suomiensis TaxID=1337062 RepID=UPI003342EC23
MPHTSARPASSVACSKIPSFDCAPRPPRVSTSHMHLVGTVRPSTAKNISGECTLLSPDGDDERVSLVQIITNDPSSSFQEILSRATLLELNHSARCRQPPILCLLLFANEHHHLVSRQPDTRQYACWGKSAHHNLISARVRFIDVLADAAIRYFDANILHNAARGARENVQRLVRGIERTSSRSFAAHLFKPEYSKEYLSNTVRQWQDDERIWSYEFPCATVVAACSWKNASIDVLRLATNVCLVRVCETDTEWKEQLLVSLKCRVKTVVLIDTTTVETALSLQHQVKIVVGNQGKLDETCTRSSIPGDLVRRYESQLADTLEYRDAWIIDSAVVNVFHVDSLLLPYSLALLHEYLAIVACVRRIYALRTNRVLSPSSPSLFSRFMNCVYRAFAIKRSPHSVSALTERSLTPYKTPFDASCARVQLLCQNEPIAYILSAKYVAYHGFFLDVAVQSGQLTRNASYLLGPFPNGATYTILVRKIICKAERNRVDSISRGENAIMRVSFTNKKCSGTPAELLALVEYDWKVFTSLRILSVSRFQSVKLGTERILVHIDTPDEYIFKSGDVVEVCSAATNCACVVCGLSTEVYGLAMQVLDDFSECRSWFFQGENVLISREDERAFGVITCVD